MVVRTVWGPAAGGVDAAGGTQDIALDSALTDWGRRNVEEVASASHSGTDVLGDFPMRDAPAASPELGASDRVVAAGGAQGIAVESVLTYGTRRNIDDVAGASLSGVGALGDIALRATLVTSPEFGASDAEFLDDVPLRVTSGDSSVLARWGARERDGGMACREEISGGDSVRSSRRLGEHCAAA